MDAIKLPNGNNPTTSNHQQQQQLDVGACEDACLVFGCRLAATAYIIIDSERVCLWRKFSICVPYAACTPQLTSAHQLLCVSC
jgi:hypothetical protein